MFFISDNQMNWAVAYCLQFCSLHSSCKLSPHLWSAGRTRLDWNPGSPGGWTTTSLCGPTQNSCKRVYFILLLLCVFAYLTAELPLTVLYLSLPLRKLLQYLWLLRNCGGVCECLYVCLWMQDYGKSSTHLTELFPVFTFILYIFFFFSCSLQPKPGFYHKAGQSTLPYYYNTIMVTIITVRCSWQFE